jgi:hypothetical protein
MKSLILITLSIVSLNAFSETATYGQNEKSPCPYANQSERDLSAKKYDTVNLDMPVAVKASEVISK